MNDTTQTTITEQAAEQAASSELKLPDRALIILPTRNAVLFPGVVAPLGLGRPQSIAGAQAAACADKPIGVVLQKDASIDTPGPEHLHQVGTVAEILRYVTTPDGSHHLVARGTRRFRVTEFLTGYPFLVALVDEVGEAEVYSTEIAARTITLLAPSKAFNLPGLVCAFAVVSNDQVREKLQALAFSSGEHPYTLGVTATIAAYRDSGSWLNALVAYLNGNRDTLVEYVHAHLPGITTTCPEGTFLAWLDCRELGLEETPFQFFLDKARVGLVDGAMFGKGGEGFIRLNFGCPRSTLIEGLERMRRAVEAI